MKALQLGLRLGLVGLLPVIAFTLYVEGQKYDPALIDFAKVRGQGSSPPAAPLQTVFESASKAAASEFAGFLKFGEEHRYTKDNLYEHVDGHAEYFISAGFVGLVVTEYSQAGSSKPFIQTEVFDMGKDIQAFGVLVDESGENAPPVSIGTAGFKTSGGITFVTGRYYVKVTAMEPKTELISFAKAFASSLPGETGPLTALDKLPKTGTGGKTRFIKEGYRGLDFFNNVIEREYKVDGKKITFALLAGGSEELGKTEASFLGYLKRSGIPVETSREADSTIYKVADKYEGSWFLVVRPNSAFALFGTDENKVLKLFMK